MSSFDEALSRFSELAAERAEKRARDPIEPESLPRLAGATFREGERVFDRVSGQEVTVVYTAYRHILVPPPER